MAAGRARTTTNAGTNPERGAREREQVAGGGEQIEGEERGRQRDGGEFEGLEPEVLATARGAATTEL